MAKHNFQIPAGLSPRQLKQLQQTLQTQGPNPVMVPANNTPLIPHSTPTGYSNQNTFEHQRPFNATAYRHSLKGQTTAELHHKLHFHEKKLREELRKPNPDRSLIDLERKEISVLRGVIESRADAAYARKHPNESGGGGGSG